MAYVSTRIVVHSSLKGTKVVLTYAIKATPAAIAAMQSLYTASVRRIKWAQGWMHFVFSSLFTALAHRLQPLLVWAQDRLVRAVDATIAFVVTYGPRAWIALKRSVRPTYRAFLRAAVAIRLWTVWFHELYIEPFIERVKHVAVRAWPTLKAGLVAVFHACVDLDRQMRPYVIKGLRTSP
ncbi:hypothetical protein BC831DRAFT_314457 [Entophlyctis helioformis]|nr:hypothetical protein BC831DRAFT_314457 [Entophlyctis helioformis]